MRKRLDEYNSYISDQDIQAQYNNTTSSSSYSSITYDNSFETSLMPNNLNHLSIFKTFLDCTLIRRFVGDFDHGGRLYGGAHIELGGRVEPSDADKPFKRYRRDITINGNSVTELDFSSLHINMLYNQLGLEGPGDAYSVFKEQPLLRLLAKRLMLVAVNVARSSTIFREVSKWLETELVLKAQFEASGYSLEEIYDLLLERHTAIRPLLNNPATGLKLQRMDSDIAFNIIDEMMNQGIPCLPVHDSFIVPSQHEKLLEETMKAKYKERMGFDIRVAKKY